MDVLFTPTKYYTTGIVKTITVKSSKNAAYKLSFNLYLDILELEEGLKDTSFKYALYQDDGTDPIKSGSFTEEYLSTLDLCETNNTPHIVLVDDETITTTKITYTLYIWIDGTVDNPSSMESQSFNFKLHADGANAVLAETMAQYISNLYTPNDTAVNNGITYNLDTTNSLMNDRLGGTEDLSSGIGNIRYYGANPNNYIDIGDTYTTTVSINNMEKNSIMMKYLELEDEDSCRAFFDCATNYENIGDIHSKTYASEAECLVGLQNDYRISSVDELCGTEVKQVGDSKLYRIIGLFKDVELSDGSKQDLVKVVREDSIGVFAYDSNGSAGEWFDASLMTTLNNEYYYASGEVTDRYWDILDEETYIVTTDLTAKGLNSNVQSKIAEVVWNLGGFNDYEGYSDDFYIAERGEAKCGNCTYEKAEWVGKIALMYSSDAGYGSNFKYCNTTLFNYYNDTCKLQNWITTQTNGNLSEWLLNPYTVSYNYFPFFINNGLINNDYWNDNSNTQDGFGVRPTFYLTSKVNLVSGTGTGTDPYIVN